MLTSKLIEGLQKVLNEEGDKETFIRINDAVIPIDHITYNIGLDQVGIVSPVPTDLEDYFF